MDRLSERIIIVKIVLENIIINVVSTYALQVALDKMSKEQHWEELNLTIVGLAKNEKLIVEADFKAHIGTEKKE